MTTPTKVLIFSLSLALSLGLAGWMFASCRQSEENLRQAGQKNAALEKEKSALEEEFRQHQTPPPADPPRTQSVEETQRENLQQQIRKQEQNVEILRSRLQESEHQLRTLKTRETDRESLLKALILQKKKEAASIVLAPKSIAGATITIEFEPEGGEKGLQLTFPPGEYTMEEGDYTPQGRTASITFQNSEPFGTTIWGDAKFINHIVTGAKSFNEMLGADKTPPAVITFTARNGNSYTGSIKGYWVNDRMQQHMKGSRLSRITITLP